MQINSLSPNSVLQEPRLLTTALGTVELAQTTDAPRILALHGAMGGYDQSLLLARALIPDAGAIALSRPGYLGSPLSLGPTPEQQADLYAAVLSSLGIDRIVVAAVSGGGPSAIHFALRHPDRCRQLILVSTPAGPMPGYEENLKRINKMRRMLLVPGLLPLLRWQAGRDPLRGVARAVPDPELYARVVADPEAMGLLVSLQQGTLRNLAARMPGTLHDTTAFGTIAPLPVSDLTVPTLVIHAENDPVVDVTHARRILAETPLARGLILPSGGHVALFTHLDAVRDAVADSLGIGAEGPAAPA